MKYFSFCSFLILTSFSLIVIACKEKKFSDHTASDQAAVQTATDYETGRVYSRSTPNGYYALYIPDSLDRGKRIPVIIFLDPQGDGSFPLAKYKGLADKFGLLLIGSNESRNGIPMENSIEICSRLYKESVEELPGHPSLVTLAGFSGGAKAALVAGNSTTGIRGIVYCGAAFPPGQFHSPVPLLGFTGNKDMNYTEVKSFNSSLEETSARHALVEWQGKHEWPDTSVFIHAFYWCKFNEMKMTTEKDKYFTEAYIALIKNSIAKASILEKVSLLKEAVFLLDSLAPVGEFQNKLTKIVSSKPYLLEKKRHETTMNYEEKYKSILVNSFDTEDFGWWKKEISKLRSEKNNSTNERLLSYTSLAAYSFSSNAVKINNSTLAQKYLDIYKIADPENSEHAFLRACLYAKNNLPDSALFYLNESVALGLKDRNKITSEESLFSLHGKTEYIALLGKLK